MKTVLLLVGLVALVMGSVPHHHDIKLKAVESKFVEYQKKILALFEHFNQPDYYSDYYKVGKDYDIEANLQNYSNKQAVEEFLLLYRTGTLPKYYKFSIFYERMRDEAIALFHVLYYAKDFETFYKTAAWAKVYMNEEQFFYAYYIAIVQRKDTAGIVLPAPYEVYPQFFMNKDVQSRLYSVKMQNGFINEKVAAQYGMVKENNNYIIYANYSTSLSYPNKEQKLSYFTEDIGLNSYYFYFHSQMPFWWKSEKWSVLKDRLGEVFFYYYQQLLARYYLERLPHGLGEIPEFSWYSNFKSGYYPQLYSVASPFVQRSNDYNLHNEKNYEYIRFLDTYEKTFFQFLQKAEFKSPEKEMNYVGNYWHVKINDVQVGELVTYFDYFDYNATSSAYYSKEELKAYPVNYIVRQPRLNHKPFSVKLDVKSDVASDAVFKIFIGPKYHANGYPVNIEDDWMKFYELDWFVQKLVPGENKIERKSSEFVLFKDDSVPINEIYEWLEQGKVPYDMSVQPDNMPRRLMLPKGTRGGFPFQLFVFAYPYNSVKKGENVFESYILDNKPFGYPFDRPVREAYFRQPNVFFKDVRVYHKDSYYPYQLNVPSYFLQKKI
ncbi:unnamed protein product [Spodoptera littoralis]|uniref:Uncharacterized protein n=1 Tax=Spodoptera littoralis TaxID=7109 RepID=A0A9P0N1K3_SPOLI|nr:unnamed protein product [Spodoptera littoralis]CAH1639111.1 unnamed protein product [Spodoptera littoralis]